MDTRRLLERLRDEGLAVTVDDAGELVITTADDRPLSLAVVRGLQAMAVSIKAAIAAEDAAAKAAETAGVGRLRYVRLCVTRGVLNGAVREEA